VPVVGETVTYTSGPSYLTSGVGETVTYGTTGGYVTGGSGVRPAYY